MRQPTMREKLHHYIDAGFPIIYIHTFEEEKVDRILSEFSEYEIYEWNESSGYINFVTKTPVMEDCSLDSMLDQQKTEDLLEGKLLILKDIASYLSDHRIVSKIKGLAKMIYNNTEARVVIVSSILTIPQELEKYITILEMDYLTTDEIREIIHSFIDDNGLGPVRESLINEFSIAFKGLTEFEINNLLALAYSDDGELTKSDLRLIFEQKQQVIKKAGILEMIPLRETLDDIGGLEKLKTWLKRKEKVYKNMETANKFGVDLPKGVMIVGIPGCGKSLTAKAAASLFEVPLLRMDMGRLMGKYVGESESNMRRAISLAEAIAPCVLWIDELEKAFAGIGGSNGGADVTTRLFGNFLTWMQAKDNSVFVVATANNIIGLPAELLRKGRFDEIFFVGLPSKDERKKIFQIHIEKRRRKDIAKIDLGKLADSTEGFSGSDIESIVKEAVESAYTEGKPSVETGDFTDAISQTNSVSEIMGKELDQLQEEYRKRNFKRAS